MSCSLQKCSFGSSKKQSKHSYGSFLGNVFKSTDQLKKEGEDKSEYEKYKSIHCSPYSQLTGKCKKDFDKSKSNYKDIPLFQKDGLNIYLSKKNEKKILDDLKKKTEELKKLLNEKGIRSYGKSKSKSKSKNRESKNRKSNNRKSKNRKSIKRKSIKTRKNKRK